MLKAIQDTMSVDRMRFHPFPVIILLFKTSNKIDRGILQWSVVSTKLKQTPITKPPLLDK